jgi:hypothetical protein
MIVVGTIRMNRVPLSLYPIFIVIPNTTLLLLLLLLLLLPIPIPIKAATAATTTTGLYVHTMHLHCGPEYSIVRGSAQANVSIAQSSSQ